MTRSLNRCVDRLSALRNCTRASENGHLIAEECAPYREGLVTADLTTSFHIELDVSFATESHHHRFLGDSPDYLKGPLLYEFAFFRGTGVQIAQSVLA